MLRIGQTMSDAQLTTTVGELGVHKYFRGSWGLLVCYVADFSAVCAGELSRLTKDFDEFNNRNVKILGISCDSIDSHIKWIEDIKTISGIKSDEKFYFPLVSDCNRMLSLYLNVLDAKCTDQDGLPLPCRATFILAPDMTIQTIHFYPKNIGRNFDETLRSIDALQLSFKFDHDILTPCDWKPTIDCLVLAEISKDDIKKKYSTSTIIELPSKRDYMRTISKSGIEINQEKKNV